MYKLNLLNRYQIPINSLNNNKFQISNFFFHLFFYEKKKIYIYIYK